MKKLILFLAFAACFAACDNDDDCPTQIDYNEFRSNMVGSWNAMKIVTAYENNTAQSADTSTYTTTISSNGTGVRINSLNIVTNFDWFYQYNPEMVVLIDKALGGTIEDPEVFDVNTNESNIQEWSFRQDDVLNIVDYYETRVILSK